MASSDFQKNSFIKNMKTALNDIISKDLHFVFETCMVSCHQSILVPRSPFLKSLLASQECGVGARNLTVFLAGVKPETMQRVIDYIYTGTCSLGTVKHIMEMIAVKKMLNLDIDIERKLYRKDTNFDDTPVKDTNKESRLPKIVGTESLALKVERRRSFEDESINQHPQVEETNQTYVTPLKLSLKTENSSYQQPIINSNILEVENSSFSFFDKVVQSIMTDDPSNETENEVNPDPVVDNIESQTNETPQQFVDYESIRQEIYADVGGNNDGVNNEENREVTENVIESKAINIEDKTDDVDSDSDSDDESSSSSSSSGSSSDDSDSDNDDNNMENKVVEKVIDDTLKTNSNSVSQETPIAVDDDCDSSLPGIPDEDGVPRIPTSVLIQELENDETRINQSISVFLARIDRTQAGDCSECGQQLSPDNFVLHYDIHLEEIKSSKKKLLDQQEVEEQTRLEMEAEAEQEIAESCSNSYDEPNTPMMVQVKLEEDSSEMMINKFQENQKSLSRDIVTFMGHFQRGVKTLECSECGETVTQGTIVSHFKTHINELSRKIEVLVTRKREKKRKHWESRSSSRDDGLKKKIRESSSKPRQSRHASGGGSVSSSDGEAKSRIGTEEERKKMYKRIYGRKKYQYRIKNKNENVTVSEEEIDAEIAKEKSKFSGQPSTGAPGLLGDPGQALTPGEMLRQFVHFGSKEYKHEFKKARDRLYKRKLRVLRTQGIMDNSAALDIPRADIELEMLSRYTANKSAEQKFDRDKDDDNIDADRIPQPPNGSDEDSNPEVEKFNLDNVPVVQEVQIKTETSMLEDDLELGLDNVEMGELMAEAQSMMGFDSMLDIVSAVQNVQLPSNNNDALRKLSSEEKVLGT